MAGNVLEGSKIAEFALRGPSEILVATHGAVDTRRLSSNVLEFTWSTTTEEEEERIK